MLADKLHKVLADSCVLFAKTQNYHWNVTGENFKSLHEMFENQYTDLFNAIDVLAEIIRSLGEKVDGTYKNYLSLSDIKEGNMNASASDMLAELANDHTLIQAALKDALNVAEAENNIPAATFLSDRISVHSKAIWFLKSSL